MALNLHHSETFESRHHGTPEADIQAMLQTIGVKSLDEWIDKTVPEAIRLKKPLNLPAPKSEADFLADLKKVASKNQVFKFFIGMGYYDTFTPKCDLRNTWKIRLGTLLTLPIKQR